MVLMSSRMCLVEVAVGLHQGDALTGCICCHTLVPRLLLLIASQEQELPPFPYRGFA